MTATDLHASRGARTSPTSQARSRTLPAHDSHAPQNPQSDADGGSEPVCDDVRFVDGGPATAAFPNLVGATQDIQRAATVAALRRRPQSRVSLSKELGLSASVVSRLVGSLIATSVITEIGVETSGVGRPRTTLGLSPQAGRLVSLIVDREGLDCHVVDVAGSLIATASRTIESNPLEPALIIDFLAEVMAASADAPLWGIGISAPGIVDAYGTVRAAPDLGWTDPVGLRSMVAQQFDTLVTVDNDVNLMVLAEAANGWARDKRDVALLYLGHRGIGLGAISQGSLLTGATGASGEIGLLRLGHDEGLSFEQCFSLEAVSQRLRDLGREPGADPMDALMAATHEGIGTDYLDSLLRSVTQALGIVSLLLEPEVVVLGGSMRTVCRGREAGIERSLSGWVPAPPAVRLSQLGEQEIHWAAQMRCWDQIVATGL